MDPSPHQTEQEPDIQQAIESMPESLKALCLSGQSVRNLAHLAKNILQMTSGSVDIVKLGIERKQYGRIERSWDIFEPNFVRLKKFVLDLIRYTKHYTLQKTNCDLNSIVTNAIKSCQYALDNNEISLQLLEDKAIPTTSLDADRIEEMAANLITHAVDNLTDHQGEITIRTSLLKEHGQVQVSVSDSAPPLTNDVIRALEEPFERTANMVGTGFDIPLAKLYVEQHGGYLEFENDEKNCVHVYLPME
jgi:signal transduction histidine kinase